MTLNIALVFNGHAEAAGKFYAEVLGGRVEPLHRYSEMPPTPGFEVPEGLGERILHSELTFPGGKIMLADSLPNDPRAFGEGQVMTLSVDTVEQAEAAWDGLSGGARSIECPLGEAFFARSYGELVDRFGLRWAVMAE